MLENTSVTWGGAGHLLVPVGDAAEIHPELWKLVELYDADQWAGYVYTYRGHQLADPEGFDAWLTRQARRWSRKYGGGIKRARKTLSADHLMTDPIGGWPLPDALTDRLLRLTGVATENGHPMFAMYRADGNPDNHLVDVADLEPLPTRVKILGSHVLPLSLQVVLAVRTGGLAPSHQQRLIESGVSIESVPVNLDDLDFLLRLAWLGAQRSGRWSLHQAVIARVRGETRAAPPYFEDDFLEAAPIALSRIGCSEFTRWHPGHDERPLTVVVGDHVDDFAYALALDRCGLPAIWLPGEFVSAADELSRSVREVLAECLAAPGPRRASERRPVLTSLSLPTQSVRPLQESLMNTTWGSRLLVDIADSLQLPPYRVPTLMDAERFDDALDTPFLGDEMAGNCPVATPSRVSAKDPWKLRWWVEIETPGHALPGRSALNDAVVAESTSWRATARCGRDGISFPSHIMGLSWAGAPLEQLLERPRIRLPNALTIFQTLATKGGLSLKESSAGRFRRLTIDLWGSLDRLAADLADPRTRALLDTYLSMKPSGEVPGVFTNSRRRFLNLVDICTVGGLDPPEARELVDRLLGNHVLRRGLALQCNHCRLYEWYEMEEVGQSFTCRRCRSITALGRGSWKGATDEPAFYYDLAEVAFQALRSNVHVPVAALAALKRDTKSFLDLPEVELTDAAGSTIELDLLAVVDGRIVVGEAKAGDRLRGTQQAEVDWLRRFADTATALSADEAVFATATAWRPVTADRIQSAFAATSIEVRLLEGI